MAIFAPTPIRKLSMYQSYAIGPVSDKQFVCDLQCTVLFRNFIFSNYRVKEKPGNHFLKDQVYGLLFGGGPKIMTMLLPITSSPFLYRHIVHPVFYHSVNELPGKVNKKSNATYLNKKVSQVKSGYTVTK